LLKTTYVQKGIDVPTVDVSNGKVHYLEEGKGASLVFLHGVGAQAGLWSPVIGKFGGRFHTISFDLRGHGGSICNGAISVDAIVQDILEALHKLEIRQFHLVGVSLGGAVALRIASARAHKVKSLTLSGIGVTLGKPLGDALADEVYGIREASVYLAIDRFVEQVAENLLMPDSPRARIEALAASIGIVTKRGYLEALQAFAAADNIAAAAGVKCRTLILNGASDELVSSAAADALSKVITTSLRREIPDAGHHANIDNPEAFAAELIAVLGT
jgi:pimeloyl-ACP methyl ester carboxylesterase